MKHSATLTSIETREEDVLMGRGMKFQYHPGNMLYNDLVARNRDCYFSTSRPIEKRSIIEGIVDRILAQGRFLQHATKTLRWIPITKDRALTKTAHAIQYRQRQTLRKRCCSSAAQKRELVAPMALLPSALRVAAMEDVLMMQLATMNAFAQRFGLTSFEKGRDFPSYANHSFVHGHQGQQLAEGHDNEHRRVSIVSSFIDDNDASADLSTMESGPEYRFVNEEGSFHPFQFNSAPLEQKVKDALYCPPTELVPVDGWDEHNHSASSVASIGSLVSIDEDELDTELANLDW